MAAPIITTTSLGLYLAFLKHPTITGNTLAAEMVLGVITETPQCTGSSGRIFEGYSHSQGIEVSCLRHHFHGFHTEEYLRCQLETTTVKPRYIILINKNAGQFYSSF